MKIWIHRRFFSAVQERTLEHCNTSNKYCEQRRWRPRRQSKWRPLLNSTRKSIWSKRFICEANIVWYQPAWILLLLSTNYVLQDVQKTINLGKVRSVPWASGKGFMSYGSNFFFFKRAYSITGSTVWLMIPPPKKQSKVNLKRLFYSLLAVSKNGVKIYCLVCFDREKTSTLCHCLGKLNRSLIINQCTLCFCDAQSLSPDKYYGIIGIHYRDGGTSEQNARKVLVTQYTG